MSHQDGLGNNGAEATGLTKPDDVDDHVQKKSENVAHGRNGIQLNKLENSGHLRNSPTTRSVINGQNFLLPALHFIVADSQFGRSVPVD